MVNTSGGQVATADNIEYAELVDGHRIHGSLYSDRTVYRDEMERIWHRVWVFVGHESEVSQPGDYVRKSIGEQPIIMTRTADGDIRLLLNRCAHRGTTVCQHDRGNSTSFRCSYHGWTYRNSGELIGVPFRSGYGDDFDVSQYQLGNVPRVASYRGFVFGSLAHDGPTLEEHLGNVRPLLDRFVDLSPTGRLDLRGGVNKGVIRANWKMWLENATDNYHVSVVHQSALAIQGNDGRARTLAQSRDSSLALARDLGGGHGELDFAPQQAVAGRVYAGSLADTGGDDDARRYEEQLVRRHGEEKARELLSTAGPPHFAVFPNLFIRAPQEVRVIYPVGPGVCHQHEYVALLEDVPSSINAERVRRHQTSYGPAGFFMADDIDLWERTQRGVEGHVDEWLELRRGLHRESAEAGGMRVGHVTDEVAQRGMWRHYLELMTA